MITVEVLGVGCSACNATYTLIGEMAKAMDVPIDLRKVDDLPTIMRYGILATPGVVIAGKLVHAGGMPSRDKIVGWLKGT